MNRLIKKLILEGYGLKYPVYVIGQKLSICKGQYKDWKFTVEGLNLSKTEVQVYGGKRFHYNGFITIRIFNFIITYDSNGILHTFRNMNIIEF